MPTTESAVQADLDADPYLLPECKRLVEHGDIVGAFARVEAVVKNPTLPLEWRGHIRVGLDHLRAAEAYVAQALEAEADRRTTQADEHWLAAKVRATEARFSLPLHMEALGRTSGTVGPIDPWPVVVDAYLGSARRRRLDAADGRPVS